MVDVDADKSNFPEFNFDDKPVNMKKTDYTNYKFNIKDPLSTVQ